MRLWALTAVLLLCISSNIVHANLTDSVGIEFQVASFSKSLTQQTVSQTFQDSRGILWFVTQEGLNKYNGHELENYRYSPSDPMSLSTDRVSGIAEDSNGDLWVSTLGGGLNKYDPIKNGFTAKFPEPENSNSPLSNNIFTVFSHTDGQIFLGYDSGFSVFNPIENTFKHYQSGLNGVPEFGVINNFAETSDGTVWAATANHGLLEIDQKSRDLVLVLHQHSTNDKNTIPSNSINRLIADKKDRVWIMDFIQ